MQFIIGDEVILGRKAYGADDGIAVAHYITVKGVLKADAKGKIVVKAVVRLEG